MPCLFAVVTSFLLLYSHGITAQDEARHLSVSGCDALAVAFRESVFYAGSPVYAYENQEFWSNTEILNPDCIFRPTRAAEVAAGISILNLSKGKFAVRGGGHMGIKGANNIDNGVLVVMSNLTTLSLSADRRTVSVGPAYKWGDVYGYLEAYDLTVAGGRLSPVGVPGLLLGGGINFYGNQHGFSADTVVKYEVVLASGQIVYATKNSHSDLFWALKGGSSNFGIVTRFDMQTIPSKKVWAGVYTVGGQYLPEFLAAIANYSSNIVDPLSHIVPAVVPIDPVNSVGVLIAFYNSETVTYPECFKPFTDIPAVANSFDFKTVNEFALETGILVTPHINDLFTAGSVVGKTYAQLLEGIQIINDTFFSALPALYAQVPAANISIIEIDWQPIGALWMTASSANGGNALGLDPTKGVYLCYAEVVEWIGDAYNDIVMDWVVSTTSAINAATKAAGLYDSFNYMGDASGFQSIFSGYGKVNEERLLSISRKYDPKRLFQTLMPGGFKTGM